MIERERRGDIGVAGEGDEADAVVGSFGDELFQHILGDGQSVDALSLELEILRAHAAGEVNRDHDVNAAGPDRSFAFAQLRPGQRDDEQRERKPAQLQED